MKLIYINSEGESITISKDRPYIFNKQPNLDGVDCKILKQKSPDQKGESYIDTLINGKDINLNIYIVGDTLEKLELSKQKLLRVFNPEIGKGKLIYIDKFKQRYMDVYVDGDLKINDNGSLKFAKNVIVDLYACNPYWYQDADDLELAATIGGLEFPLDIVDDIEFEQDGKEIQVNNVGTSEAGVVIEFNGPAVNPKVINMTTGEYVQVDTTLNEGQVLTIDTNDRNIRIELDGVDAFNLININSTLWKLKRGINILSYEAGDVSGANTANVKIKYKTKWNGV